MTDIRNTGNIGANRPEYGRGEKNEWKIDKTCQNVQSKEMDAKDLHGLDAMSAYNQGQISRTSSKGEYKFDPNAVKKDVEVFMENYDMATSCAKEYMQDLIDSGCEPTVAMEKAYQYGACLMSMQNR